MNGDRRERASPKKHVKNFFGQSQIISRDELVPERVRARVFAESRQSTNELRRVLFLYILRDAPRHDAMAYRPFDRTYDALGDRAGLEGTSAHSAAIRGA
jgi:hypothetical protein